MTELAITRWPSLVATEGAASAVTWPTLAKMLKSKRPFAGDRVHPGWSAATFTNGKRAKDCVQSVTALVLDYDKGPALETILDTWTDVDAIGHTTRKHTPEAPRCRVVLRLSRPVTPVEYAVLFSWADRRVREHGHEIDQAPKDPSRFWYLPGTATGHFEFLTNDVGEPLVVDDILARETARSTPPALPSKGPDWGHGWREQMERARAYARAADPAISGDGGHSTTLRIANAIAVGFDLCDEDALDILLEWNRTCQPPWPRKDLERKIHQARKTTTDAPGYLLREPRYRAPAANDVAGERVVHDDDLERAAIQGEPASSIVKLGPCAESPLRGLDHLPKVALLGRARILARAQEPVVYAWQGIAVVGTIIVLGGPPGGGKTSLLFLILCARANPTAPISLLGREVRPASEGSFVVLIEGEQSEGSTARKLVRYLEILGLPDDTLDRIIIVARKAVRLGSPEWRDVEAMVRAGVVSDVALDTLARVAPGDANDEREQVTIFDSIAATIETAPKDRQPTIWIAAHTNKTGDGISADSISGSRQRVGQGDSILTLKPETVDGRTVAATLFFPKLREEQDDDEITPITFTVNKSKRAIDCTAGPTERDERPLEERILSLLATGAKTKTAIREALHVRTDDVETAISNLFSVRAIAATDVMVSGRPRKAFRLSGSTGQEHRTEHRTHRTETPPDEHGTVSDD